MLRMSLGALNLERPRLTTVSTVRINHKHCRDDFCSSFCATETLLTSGRLLTPEFFFYLLFKASQYNMFFQPSFN